MKSNSVGSNVACFRGPHASFVVAHLGASTAPAMAPKMPRRPCRWGHEVIDIHMENIGYIYACVYKYIYIYISVCISLYIYIL